MQDAMQQTIDRLVAGNRILYGERVLDAFGHISARSPENPERFFMARSMAPGLVTAADILEYDMEGEPVRMGGPDVYLERFIHAAVLSARPDVNSVVHSHAEAVLPFSLTKKTRLRAVLQPCGFVGCGVPVFDTRDVKGDAANLLVNDMRSGHALAQSLAGETLVLMRGHGMTVAGRSVELAVFHSIYATMNARVQFAAMQIDDDYSYLSDGELAAIGQVKNPSRAWDLWCDRYVP